MRKLRNLIGMPVVMGGKKIGRLIQAELSDDLRELCGLWIDAGMKGKRRIAAENLEMIGEKSIISDSPGVRGRCKAAFPMRRAVSTDGRRMGAIVGVQIDEITFAIQALELSMGLWDDLYSGRRRITRYTVNNESGDIILMDPAEENSEEEQT